MKAIVENGVQYAVGNITGTVGALTFRGDAGTGDDLRLTINARVECSPERLDELVRSALDAAIADKHAFDILEWRYLQPGRPNPTYRFDQVVG